MSENNFDNKIQAVYDIDSGINNNIDPDFGVLPPDGVDPDFTAPDDDRTDPSFGVIPGEGVDPSFSVFKKPEELLLEVDTTYTNKFSLISFLEQFPYLIASAMREIVEYYLLVLNESTKLKTTTENTKAKMQRIANAIAYLDAALIFYNQKGFVFVDNRKYIKDTCLPVYLPCTDGISKWDDYYQKITIRKVFVQTYQLLSYFFNEEIFVPFLATDVFGCKVEYLKNCDDKLKSLLNDLKDTIKEI